MAFEIASKGQKNVFAFLSIQKSRVCGISDIPVAAFLVRDARSLNSWIAQTLKSAGKWAFKKFEIQSSILFKLFDPILGESQMIHWKGKSKDAKKIRSQKSKTIKTLMVAYLRSIEI